MASSKTLLFLLLLVPCAILMDVKLKNSNNYGPYTVSYSDFQLCIGPRRDNATRVEAQLLKQNGSDVGQFNLTFAEDTVIDEIRLTVYNVKGQYRSVFWTYKFKEPCRYYAISNMIQQLTNEKDCILRKGRFSFTINFMDAMEIFIGKSFFYGVYSLKSIVVSKRGNIYCGQQTIEFKKKI